MELLTAARGEEGDSAGGSTGGLEGQGWGQSDRLAHAPQGLPRPGGGSPASTALGQGRAPEGVSSHHTHATRVAQGCGW